MAVFVFALYAHGDDRMHLPVLMYHHISPNPKDCGNYTISPETFEGDLEYLRSHGYSTISLKQLVAYSRGEIKLPKKCILITFDDGYISFDRYTLPLLKKYDMCGVVSVIGSGADAFTNNEDSSNSFSFLSWPQLAELKKSKQVEIISHSYDMHSTEHRKGCKRMNHESREVYSSILNRDIDKTEERFETYLGEKPFAFAYPYGYYCIEGKKILCQRGYTVLFSCNPKINRLSGNPNELLSLGRFNRPNDIDREKFFKKVLS